MTTTQTTREAGTRYRTRSEAVDVIQIAEDNGPAVLAFCGVPEAPSLKVTINALPGPDGGRMPVNLRPGDWIVRHGAVPREHFTVHGPTAFGLAYEPVPGASAVHRPGPRRMVARQVAPQECLSCGQRWPCDGSWQARAEAAEARLAETRAALRRHTHTFTDHHDTEICGGCLEPAPCPDAMLAKTEGGKA